MGWQWHQLDHMQIICTSLQTDNHASTSPLSFYSPDALPDAKPTASKHRRQLCVSIEAVQSYWAVQIVAKSFWLPTPTRNAQNAPSRLWSTGPCICWVDETWHWHDLPVWRTVGRRNNVRPHRTVEIQSVTGSHWAGRPVAVSDSIICQWTSAGSRGLSPLYRAVVSEA